jgi:hypothetical protein
LGGSGPLWGKKVVSAAALGVQIAWPCGETEWAHLGLNQGPLACEASALPLS